MSASKDPAAPPLISIIVPVLNERNEIGSTLESIWAAIREIDFVAEVICVDGGSTDGTREWLEADADAVGLVSSNPGRATQMNAGAGASAARWLLFLHGDTHLTPGSLLSIADRLKSEDGGVFAFGLEFRDSHPAYRWMERGIAWRCRTFALPYGDQGFLIPRSCFQRIEGFRSEAFLEDVDLVLRLRSLGMRFEMLAPCVRTSSRQYGRLGIVTGVVWNLGRLLSTLCIYALSGEHFRIRRLGETIETL